MSTSPIGIFMLRRILGLLGIGLLVGPLHGLAAVPLLQAGKCPFIVSGSVSQIRSEPNVFYVNLFGGPWPIPNRYEILGVTRGGSIRLMSPSESCLVGTNICRKKIGLIRYGKLGKRGELSSIEQIAPKSKKRYAKGVRIINQKYGELKVVILREKFTNSAEPEQSVVIYNDKEYILIADENKNLWKCMLTLHQDIKNKLASKNLP